ncbi:MAG: hypothetical protein AAF688_09215 [Bacteroidota bacterium]
MIKLFRNIRKRLLSEGKIGSPTEASAKVGTYFKYAIGEIIFVVIGIFMAETLAPTLKGGVSQNVKQ